MTASDQALDLIETLRRQGISFCVATILRTADSTSARAGAKAVVTADGDMHGFVGGSCVTGAVRRAAAESLKSGAPKLIRIKPGDQVAEPVDVDGVELHKSGCPSGGTVDVFLEPMRAPRTLLVCGASPIAQAIVQVARTLGFRIVCSCRGQDAHKMAAADRFVADFDAAELALNPGDAAVVATQGAGDLAALRLVLGSPAAYKGMVCSRRKLAKLTATLTKEDPALAAEFARLHAPAGLNIGAIEPEEIALSVVAEIVEHRRAEKVEGEAVVEARGA